MKAAVWFLFAVVACGESVHPQDAGARHVDARADDSENDDDDPRDDDPKDDDESAMTRDASRARRDAAQAGSDDCTSAARLVYVLDESGKLSSFRPDTLTFDDIGTLDCPDTGMPFSMAVDRQGTAWVLYNSGQIYGVSTEDAHCRTIARTPGSGGFSLFGMGFVALDGDAERDQLFIAGTPPLDLSFDFSTALGVIEPAKVSTSRIGALDGDTPELTGTGDGKLWAFYARDTPRRLDRIDPNTAATLETHSLGSLEGGGSSAWAIAFWGGDFWLFLRAADATSTTVYRVDGKTFEQRPVLPDTGRGIVGAGVSTCAPLVVI